MSMLRFTAFALTILTLHAPAASAIGEMDTATPATLATAAAAEVKAELDTGFAGDLTPGRMALYESARMYKKSQATWSTLDLGLQRFDYGLTDNLQLGITALVPIGVLAVAPELKFGGEVAKDLHMSIAARVGAFIVGDDMQVYGYGGSAAVTYGSADLHVTAGVHAYGLSFGGVPDAIAWLVHPTVGGVARLSDYALLHLDVGPIVAGESWSQDLGGCVGCSSMPREPDSIWLIKYGVRFHGEQLFGDVSFLVPAHEDWLEVAEYLPMGIPTLTLGYTY